MEDLVQAGGFPNPTLSLEFKKSLTICEAIAKQNGFKQIGNFTRYLKFLQKELCQLEDAIGVFNVEKLPEIEYELSALKILRNYKSLKLRSKSLKTAIADVDAFLFLQLFVIEFHARLKTLDLDSLRGLLNLAFVLLGSYQADAHFATREQLDLFFGICFELILVSFSSDVPDGFRLALPPETERKILQLLQQDTHSPENLQLHLKMLFVMLFHEFCFSEAVYAHVAQYFQHYGLDPSQFQRAGLAQTCHVARNFDSAL